MKQRLTVFLFIILTMVIIIGCSPEEPVQKEIIINIATGRDDYTCDWAGKACLYSEGLIKFDENLTIKPWLARSWEISEDKKTYIFHLRDGIKFHCGKPFTSDAIEYAFDNYYSPDNKHYGIESIESIDDLTVVFKLSRVNPIFLSTLCVYREILNPDAVKAAYDEGKTHEEIVGRVYDGTGPFIFKEWVKDQKVVFEKNPDYWQGEVKISKVIFKIIPDADTRVINIETKDIDIIGNDPYSSISLEYISRLKENNDIDVYIARPATTYGLVWFSFNTINPERTSYELFSNVNGRNAINYAVDVGTIVKTLYGGDNLPARGPISELSKLYNSNLGEHEYNKGNAKRILANLGWVDSNNDGLLDKNGKELKLVFLIGTRIPEYDDIAILVQSELGEIGIGVEIQTYEDTTLREKWKKGEFDLIIQTCIGSPHDDPQLHFETYYKGGVLPYPPVIDDTHLKKLITSLKTIAGTERIETYKEIQARIAELCPGVYLYHQIMVSALNKKFKGFSLIPLPWHRYQELWRMIYEE